MKRILFVDDESKVLQALRRMLHSLRRDWEMEFAEGARESLDRLAAAPFDVVVTDMRMPGMSGAELLGEVMNLYPATVRIILSGQCDRQSVLKCVGPAHQFLTKPCESKTLKSTLTRACSLQDHLVDERHKRAVSRVTSLPSDPVRHAELVAELESPRPSLKQITTIISGDVGMAAKVLQLVNSSFFGTPQPLSDPARAAHLLGVDTLKPLALSTSAFVPFDIGSDNGPRFEQLIDRSRAVASAAAAIAAAETSDPTVISDSCLAGLLHMVGLLALSSRRPDRDGPDNWRAAAGMRLDCSHAAAGAYLMALWGLPDTVVHAISLQCVPSRSSDRTFTPLTALHAARVALGDEESDPIGVLAGADMDYLEQVGCRDRLNAWREICRAAKPEGVSP